MAKVDEKRRGFEKSCEHQAADMYIDKVAKKEKKQRYKSEWRLLALIVDRAFFWFFLFTIAVIFCVMFLMAYFNGYSYELVDME